MRNNEQTPLLRGTLSMKQRTSQEVHICDSGERCLIINSDERPEIDPAVCPVVVRDQVAWELQPRLHKDQSTSPSHNYLE